ncbi:MAG TPA: superoxide dismutase [Alphaproteobacteria bacterium]|nr:superoxide dismutase [Alphaproteobacteria bacterium]
MQQTKTQESFTLPKLPYEENALEPVISARTLSFHHGKHHATYVTNLNKLIEGTDYAGRSLEEVVRKAAKDPKGTGIFNNGAQTWNHNFYWESMKAKGGGEPSGKLKSAIERDFGSFKDFRDAFAKAAVGQFGSGWAWVVADGGKLKITSTSNADTPIAHGQKPLITIDVWEHAYYLDYQNRRADYVAAWLDKLANWSFAEKNLG